MRVVCFGDSNTYSYDPRSFFGGRYPADSRWVDLLAEKTGWEIRNEGMNGRKIPRRAVSIPAGTDLLIVMLGTNDLLQGADAATTVSRMEVFLMGLELEQNKILMIAPPPMRLGEWVADERLIDASIQLAKGYRDLARRLGIRFAYAGDWEVLLTFDGVHFTEDGHRKFAERLYQYLLDTI